jgi:hypothetical protein
MLIKGEKPAVFPSNKSITERDWEHSLRPLRQRLSEFSVANSLNYKYRGY